MIHARTRSTARLALAPLAAACALMAAPALMLGSSAMAADQESEQSEVKTLPAPSKDWFFIRANFNIDGSAIHDTSGKMMGLIDTSRRSDLAIDPAGKAYYVSETIWSKGNRGTRQDMLSVYDSATLKLQAEIPLPGRLIIGAQLNNFVITEDGKSAYVFDFNPAGMVHVVDLAKRKVAKTVDLPGCAGLMPVKGGLVSLCSDGSLATLDLASPKAGAVTRSTPFFAATADPIYDAFNYSISRKEAVFLSYTGLVYTAKIGATSTVAAPFSIQQAAGLRAGETKPLDINWYPGGFQPQAWHQASNHLYVLMHMGEFWSQKAPASEVWDLDLTTKKVVKRFALPDPVVNIAVTQTASPKLMVTGFKQDGYIIDPKTWDEPKKVHHAGSGIIQVVEP